MKKNRRRTSPRGRGKRHRRHSRREEACDFSTTHRPVRMSLSSPDPSLELQDETSSCVSGCRTGKSVSLPCSQSVPSQSQIPFIENKAVFRRKWSQSLNDDILCYTPDIIVVENKESYWLRCPQAGLFQCNVTGLVFKMEAEGDVTYRTVPWNRRLLAKLGNRPAGPLFDIKCPQSQRSVCQLHLPHCEILSTGGDKSLFVGHVMDEGIELIDPLVITETHVIINVTGFSPYGLVNHVDSHSRNRALILLFYTPPIDDDYPVSILNVLLLPVNVVLIEVLNGRRSLYGEEIYIEIPPSSCPNLMPNQNYTLFTSPQDDAIIVQPDTAIFDESNHNYMSTFNMTLERRFNSVWLFLRCSNTFDYAWKGYVNLSARALRRQQVQRTMSLAAEDRLFSVRCGFIERVSLPALNYVLDRLLMNRVLNNPEWEMAHEIQGRNDKARFIIDTVRLKGPAASSSMISFLCNSDPLLSEYLGLSLESFPCHLPPQMFLGWQHFFNVSVFLVLLIFLIIYYYFIL